MNYVDTEPETENLSPNFSREVWSPLRSLHSHQWFKLICGASYQHIPAIRNLALIYTLAGADCIDMAPDPAVVRAARDGVAAAVAIADAKLVKPWLMVSFNAGEDPHFRKAEFDHTACPSACDRPCLPACPSNAISFGREFSGVIDALCYGCGRCLPLCPVQIIHTREQVYAPESIYELVDSGMIDAVEIHTMPGRITEFQDLWQQLAPVVNQLKLVAVSCPDGNNLREYLTALLDCMQPKPACLVWQTDGRPMSGDIGNGATRAALLLARKVLNLGLPEGFVQVAGGTNASSVAKLDAAGIDVAGVAYGSYARKIVANFLEQGGDRLEEYPQLLWQAVAQAKELVSQIKKRE
jgi:Fe-S-cluster-containing hydrogenase component 2